MICRNVQIAGLKDVSIRISGKALRSLLQANKSIGFLFRALRCGQFELFSRIHEKKWILRFDDYVVHLDSISLIITDFFIHIKKNQTAPATKFERLLSVSLKNKIILDATVRDKTTDRSRYISEFKAMWDLKRIESKEAL